MDDLPPWPDTQCNFPASRSLANQFLGSQEAQEQLLAGSGFSVQEVARGHVCLLRVKRRFLNPHKYMKYVRIYSREKYIST